MRLVRAARSEHRLLTVQMIFKLPVLSDLTLEWTPVTEDGEHEQAWSPFSLMGIFEYVRFPDRTYLQTLSR